MGARSFRPKRSSSNTYKPRRDARLRGEPMKSRHGQGAPWYTFRVPGISNPENVIADPIQRMERELTKFGEQARYRDRFAAERAKERAELAGQVVEVEDPNPTLTKREGEIVRSIVKRGRQPAHSLQPRPLPKFPDLNDQHS